MPNPNWLPLNEYSLKHKVSLSTLRRRIRSNEIQFHFEDGKYWLVDQPIAKHLRIRLPEEINSPAVAQPGPSEAPTASGDSSRILLDGANRLMQEIKAAYAKILQEKEEQILQLKEEVADLRTLAKVLEYENDRLQANSKESAPIDYWLKQNFER